MRASHFQWHAKEKSLTKIIAALASIVARYIKRVSRSFNLCGPAVCLCEHYWTQYDDSASHVICNEFNQK